MRNILLPSALISALNCLMLFQSCDREAKPVETQTENIDSLIQLYPDSVPLLVEYGNKALAMYDYEKAVASGAKAFRLDSNNLRARMLYADVLNNRPQRTMTDIAIAQRHYKVIQRLEPKNVRGLVGLAATYSQQQDFDKSFQYINEALRIDPKYRDAYIMKGSNYLTLGEVAKAKSSYETAIQQDPKFYEAYLALGLLYQNDSNEICLEYFKTALELQPTNMEILYTLAYAKQQFEKVDEAKSLYRQMTQDTSDFYVSNALFQLGYMQHFKDKNIDSAIYFYNSALKTNPMYVEAWHNLGLCYEEKGNVTQALKSYSKALKYNPEFELSRNAANRLKP